MRIREFVENTVARFEKAELCFGHGTDNPLDEAVYLVYGSVGLDFAVELESQDRELSSTELELLERRVCSRIEQRIPVAYLLGEAWFCGVPFYSDTRALIPRSPIAELIEREFQPLLSSPPGKILDMCTGSGCIGISCALQFRRARVDLADVSPDCLELAQRNIGRHGTSDRVRAIQSDLFSNIDGRYDLIVANPPYVSATEVESLPPEFHHEPRLGLESTVDGLGLPLEILRQSVGYLEEGGLLIMELGFSATRFEQRLARVPLLWLDFEHGGEGVMAITREELVRFANEIK